MNIKTLTHNGLRWINVVKPTGEEIDYLRQNFKFHPLDLEDCLSPAQRPNVDKYADYIFLILLFPVFDRKTREIRPSEVDFFIGPDYFITVHDNNLAPLVDLFDLCSANDDARDKYLQDGMERLVYTVINSLLLYCYPMMDHLNIDIGNIESRIFAGNEKSMVREILVIRRNITNFRKIMQSHKNVLKKMIDGREQHVFRINGLRTYFEQLIEDTKDIWDTLQGFKEAIEALQQTNESLISFRINDIMKTLTAVSLILLPIYVTASVFDVMKGYSGFLVEQANFFIPLFLCLGAGLSMYWYMKKKKIFE